MKKTIINYLNQKEEDRGFIIGTIFALILVPFILVSFANQIWGFFVPNEENYAQLEHAATIFAEEKSFEALQNPCIARYTLEKETNRINLFLYGHTSEQLNVYLSTDYKIKEMTRPLTNILMQFIVSAFTVGIFACTLIGFGRLFRPVVDLVLKMIVNKKTSAC